jgi:hypothetical protein
MEGQAMHHTILDIIWTPCVAYLVITNETLLSENETLLSKKPPIKSFLWEKMWGIRHEGGVFSFFFSSLKERRDSIL